MVITRSISNNQGNQEFLSLGPNKRFRPMIAASYTRNHIYGFKENDINHIMNTYYYITKKHSHNKSNKNKTVTVNSFRKKRGLEFENQVFEFWENNPLIDMNSYDNLKWTLENCQNIKDDIIRQKHDILKHIPIINPYNRVGGIPDILIRSDKIKEILSVDYPFIHEPCHYVLLEIKYSSEISNYHRNQLYCYNRALKHTQNYEPKCALILNKSKTIDMIFFTEEDKNRYESSTRWYRNIKKIKKNLTPESQMNKKKLYKKLKYIPKIKIPKISLNSEDMILDHTKRYTYYIYVLDIDVSAFKITTDKPIVWHVSIVRTDRQQTDKEPIFIKYTGTSFSPIETYKSVHFIHHNLVPDSEVIICSKSFCHWDWLRTDWKNGHKQIVNVLRNNPNIIIMSMDELLVSAWDYINSHDHDILKKIEDNSRKYLHMAMKNIK